MKLFKTTYLDTSGSGPVGQPRYTFSIHTYTHEVADFFGVVTTHEVRCHPMQYAARQFICSAVSR
jgi:hypothetical protein